MPLALAALLARPVAAHEFWLEPAVAPPGDGVVALHLFVGEALAGERVAWTTEHAAAFRLQGPGGSRDLLALVPRQGRQAELRLRLPAGRHVVTYESHPSEITLAPDVFLQYLRQEGLLAIERHRADAGLAGRPARERFRRSAKLLLGSGPPEPTLVPAGQRIEIVPLSDPQTAASAAPLAFEVRHEGRPLAGVLLRAFHRSQARAAVAEATSDPQGRVALVLPRPGLWLLNAVHMVAAPAGGDVEWDSFWASLVFVRP